MALASIPFVCQISRVSCTRFLVSYSGYQGKYRISRFLDFFGQNYKQVPIFAGGFCSAIARMTPQPRASIAKTADSHDHRNEIHAAMLSAFFEF